MKSLVPVLLAGLLMAGCEKKEEAPAPAPPKKEPVKVSTPKPILEPKKEPEPKPPDPPKETPTIVRKVLFPEKKGLLATYKCQCTGNLWTQPAEEERLCIDYCKGEMPTCGELVKEEPAPK